MNTAFADSASYEVGRNLISIPAPSGPADLMAVSRELDAIAVLPTQLEIRKPTLDDVFLTITGTKKSDVASSGGRS